jgi:hypothetical protein
LTRKRDEKEGDFRRQRSIRILPARIVGGRNDRYDPERANAVLSKRAPETIQG